MFAVGNIGKIKTVDGEESVVGKTWFQFMQKSNGQMSLMHKQRGRKGRDRISHIVELDVH